MTTRFKNAIDALVYAFFNDTLAKGTCVACAVGNIVAKSIGSSVIKVDCVLCPYECKSDEGWDNGEWQKAFVTNGNGIQQRFLEKYIPQHVKDMISLTGYSIDDLARVEAAFEQSTNIVYDYYSAKTKSEIMEDQYRGLCAVVDVLCEIEGIENPDEYKAMFAFN